MLTFFNNPWFVGIVGGILSGGIVTFLSKLFFSKKENKEYYLNIQMANSEVISTLRHSISEDYIPDIDVINSLINANSRKHNIDKKDMSDVVFICEEIIKEIMDTSFISNNKKEELFNQIRIVINKTREIESIRYNKELISKIENSLDSNYQLQKYKSKLLNETSMALGITTALLTLTITIFNDSKLMIPDILGLSLTTENEKFLIPILTTFIMMLTLITTRLYKYRFERIKKRRKKLKITKTSKIF